MVIKNSAKLQRKHPNYNEEIPIIRHLVDALLVINSTDLLEAAQCMENVDWDVKIKNYFLTSQPKEVECKTPNEKGGVWGFSELYQKNGFKFSTNINCPWLLYAIIGDDSLSHFSIIQTANLYQVNFAKENTYRGSFDVEAQNGQPVLIRYTIEMI